MLFNQVEEWHQELQAQVKGKVLFFESMSAHTSLQVGGPAECYIEPNDLDELKVIYQFAHNKKIPIFILGAGTNLLISDAGIQGIVICLKAGFSAYTVKGLTLTAQSGLMLPKLLSVSHEHGLIGLGFLAGIPGTVGGSVFMNAGTSHHFIGDLVMEALLWNPNTQSFERLHQADFQFSYRYSSLQQTNLVLLETTFTLSSGNTGEEKQLIQQLKEKRLQSQPLQYPNAGCTWKNPLHESAGRLIEEAGLKGFTLGGAMISLQHGNFIVNKGEATCEDILALMELVEKRIFDKYNIHLVRELQVIE